MSQPKKNSNPQLTPEHVMEKGYYDPAREVPAVSVVLGHGPQGQPSPAQEPSASETRPQPEEHEEEEPEETSEETGESDETSEDDDVEESKAPAGRRPKLHG
jgi:hypothetical protein